MPFTKQEVTNSLKNSKNIKEIHNWNPKEDKIVFCPKGYTDKNFSIKTETVKSIKKMGWNIVSFYDGFVVIKKKEKSLSDKKIKKIKQII